MTTACRRAVAERLRWTLDQADHVEVAWGLSWYREAHGVARMVTRLGGLPGIEWGAGIIAALSPLNDWESNVADAIAVARNPEAATPRTTGTFVDRAVAIRGGADPGETLRGRKVRTFWRLIVNPETPRLVAVDRHLVAIGAGRSLTEHEASKLMRGPFYDAVEGVCGDLAAADGLLASQVAAIAWCAWRRLKAARFQTRIQWSPARASAGDAGADTEATE